MANNIRPIKDIELFFADLITEILQLDESHVLLQYPIQGQPSSKINENYVYVKITPEIDIRPMYKNRKRVYNEDTGTYTYSQYSQRTLTLGLIFYGPASVENATLLNEMLYISDTKLKLDQFGVFLVPDRTDGPTRVPEHHNGQWWERADMELRFYEQVSVETEVETIENIDIRMEVDK